MAEDETLPRVAGSGGRARDPLIGIVLADTYELVRRIGVGGMATVYEARHLRVERRFAVKMLQGHADESAVIRARFSREAMIGSRLNHDHIAQVFDFDEAPDGRMFLVMELLEGESLAERLARQPRPPVGEAVRIVLQIADALVAAHREGVVHRDLKPANIFVLTKANGELAVKVVDFGISKIMASQSMLTHDAAVIGTPAYMSPEQADGQAEAVDHRADIYSLGVMLFQMLSGRLPFLDSNVPILLYQIVHGELPDLRELGPDLPLGLVDVVERATARESEGRFQSAGEFIEAVTAAAIDAGVLPVGTFQVSAPGSTPGAGPAFGSDGPAIRSGSATGSLSTWGERTTEFLRAPRFSRAAVLGLVFIGLVILGGVVVLVQPRSGGSPSPESAERREPTLVEQRRSRSAVGSAATRDAGAATWPDVPDSGTAVDGRSAQPAVRASSLTVTALAGGKSVLADIVLDGAVVDQTPARLLNLRPGAHLLAVRASGYRTEVRRVTLSPGKRRVEVFHLRR